MLHCFFGTHGVGTGDHLDKGMALVLVDNTGLHFAEVGKDGAEFVIGATESRLDGEFIAIELSDTYVTPPTKSVLLRTA